MNQQYTDSVVRALERAFRRAKEASKTQFGPESLFLALLEDSKGPFYHLVQQTIGLGIISELEKEFISIPTFTQRGSDPTPKSELISLLQDAEALAHERKDSFVSELHLFVLLADRRSISREKSISLIDQLAKGRRMDSATADQQLDALKKFTKDLTKLAEEGKLDPVIGRDEEIHRTMQVLCRRTKNNPVLIGHPGVGKTAIAEGLAVKIHLKEVPDVLKDRRVLALDLAELVAGAKFRGEFEERLKSVLKEIEAEEGRIILFIDEVHTLVGAGASEGTMDAANLLKPALARGTLHAIGATTLGEYQKYIEKDPALERRFQPILIEEPSQEEAIAILFGLKERYENFHGVQISDRAIRSAVILSSRYINDRFLPDKAIDLIDEAASRIRMQVGSVPFAIDKEQRMIASLMIRLESVRGESKQEHQIQQEIEQHKSKLAELQEQWNREKEWLEKVNRSRLEMERLKAKEEEAERASDYTQVARIRYKDIPECQQQIDQATNALSVLPNRLLQEEVNEQLIEEIVSKVTGIPVEKMVQKEKEDLLALEGKLEQRVVGQKEAVCLIAEAIRRSRAGLADPKRPLGTFLFLGPTGVGKTELAKAVSQLVFSGEEAIIRIDMSEYMERHSISKLIGSPPGYVGYEEGGQLTEALRRHPYSLILLDEVEKAHQDVFNLLLQVFDDGRITDSKGRVINCKNAIFILTSNIGSDLLLEQTAAGKAVSAHSLLDLLEPLLKAHFRPEFLNRIDAICPFLPLQPLHMEQIVQLQLAEVKERLQQRDLNLTWDSSLLSYLAQKGYDPSFGARPLKRLVQKEIVNLLATALLSGEFEHGSCINLSYTNNKVVYTVTT